MVEFFCLDFMGEDKNYVLKMNEVGCARNCFKD